MGWVILSSFYYLVFVVEIKTLRSLPQRMELKERDINIKEDK